MSVSRKKSLKEMKYNAVLWSTDESRFKKLRFKIESRFKKECAYNQNLST